MKKYLMHLIFVLLLLFLFLHFSTRLAVEPFVVMTPPHTVHDYKKNHDRKKNSFCVIS